MYLQARALQMQLAMCCQLRSGELMRCGYKLAKPDADRLSSCAIVSGRC